MSARASRAEPAWPWLHLPDEPIGQRDAWRAAVRRGVELTEVVGGPGGIAEWLWARWSVLGRADTSAEDLRAVALGYRRELWLWLFGDRTWTQCCAGLIGRLRRRQPTHVREPAGHGERR